MIKQANNNQIILQHAIAPANAICLAQDGKLNKQSILTCLQKHFSFPDYFGGNFDAAYDLLLDIVDTLTAPTLWRFCTGSQPTTDSDALASWQQLMQDLMHYADSKGVKLQVELFIEP
ncbi:Barstar (barnase inhibitor) [Arsukibacterium tuosuense]|uniref:Barstar (Barnase inhibitor) n=1 Tax=Arsukibacterium tuosuense TaxID=1323745 RepID=A0A285IQ07_9GAMM|nr:barstar family protein [Arsukibacterium tuosuense]SNY50099.1 Barstar (barnase inhibitor) [Arsukibacterium tuosuense]